MKIAHVLQVAAALAFTSTAAFGAEGTEAVDQAWKKAMLANDLDAVVACYGQNALMWFPDAPPASGQKAIRAAYSDLLGANTVTDVVLKNSRYETCDQMATGWGEFSLKMTPKAGGQSVTMSGRFSVVAKKENGKWVYIVDHVSADPAKKKE